MLILLFTLVQITGTAPLAMAATKSAPPARLAEPAAAGAPARLSVAMEVAGSRPIYAGEIFSVGKDPVSVVDKLNAQIELAPHSVVEFDTDAELKVLRGSALVESRGERSLRTSTAILDFTGKILVSYDHKEKSTSAFVLEGEARMINPAGENSLRLERWRGATLEIGGVLPQLIRQLDLASLETWMSGYAWPEENRGQMLKGVPAAVNVAEAPAPKHLENAKIEDYFSSIDTGEDSAIQPDYYERKFSDPDTVVAEAKAKKPAVARSMSPEEAALITLPSTKIDLGFEMLGMKEKADEVSRLGKRSPEPKRSLASVKPKPSKPAPRQEAVSTEKSEVEKVLERLRGLEPRKPVVSGVQERNSRSPASTSGFERAGIVPDPVYDYSENF